LTLIRFDSLDPLRGARSLRFSGLREVVRADRAEEVIGVLRAVEEAVAAGRHAAGFVAYEAAPAFDPALATRAPDPRLPLAWFAIYEHREDADPQAEDDAPGEVALGEWRMEVGEDEYRAKVERIRGLIAAGDSYQVNYTVRMRAPFAGDDAALYARLCRAQRSAFCAHLRIDGVSVVSASPELFFRWEGGELELRPMKGTRPRGRWTEEDDALAAELIASPKERAENLMIVDLLRNDAGRVSDFGSVRVEWLFEDERYETVHQLTSTIRSRTRPGTTLTDVFRALFPCGSVTGAPKVRTSEIIADLEDAPRGVYCGAVGFVSPGEAVFSVAIRTLLIDRAAGEAELGVGSGITHDSDAGAEYRECLAKAAFTHRAPADFRLLETLLWEPEDGFFLLDGHLDRVSRSAAYFGFRFDAEDARRGLHDAASAAPPRPHRVRLLLDRAGGIAVECAPHADSAEPVRVAVAEEPVDSRDPLLFHKTTHRAVYERAAASRPDCDDVLLVNERGELTESTIANLVVEMDGARWTPPLECGLLPGVLRADLLARGEIRERILRPEDLSRADAIWLINSVRKWRRAIVWPD
jgi:para-aminobenzoate synthetase / 4-amino-4-deoxychorismate lyase